MITAFLDTAILIDVLRRYPPAMVWLNRQNPDALFAISPLIKMEVIRGTVNKVEQQRALKLLADFDMIYLSQDDMVWAIDQQIQFQLSHGVGVVDCLIAAPCVRLQLPIYTRNLKHFAPLLGSLAVQPY